MNILIFIKTNIPRAIFLAIVCLAILAGTVTSAVQLNKYCTARRAVPFSFYGDAFKGLAQVLQDEKYIGYYTDKNIDVPKYGAEFEQVQLALAPLTLDLNNTNHRLTIFDCADKQKCQAKIDEIKARPLKQSSLGTILAITAPY